MNHKAQTGGKSLKHPERGRFVMSQNNQNAGNDSTDPRETLRGTFVSVLFIGAFCLVLWLIFFAIYLRQA